MIKIAVVEDDKKWSNLIKEYLKQFSASEGIEVAITDFCDGYDLVEGYSCDYDIILMDIEMKLMNGMEAAEEIRKIDNDVVIIFVTNMAQYAIRGYKVNALDYILKPISYIPFSETVKKAVRLRHKDEDNFIVLNNKSGTEKIKTKDIAFVESHGHRLIFYLENRKYETTKYSMKEMEGMLYEYNFRRCNSGCLVNLRFVSGYKGTEIIVLDNVITISRGKKNEFMSALTSYMTE
ncbi:MAG: LytTR family DNA-binding domain-containing protein [Pseudobutyrivibrio sp.]|nr:LytTR family DNA-binding domain-containing protein [Pseudobutyrivibrio sp.]